MWAPWVKIQRHLQVYGSTISCILILLLLAFGWLLLTKITFYAKLRIGIQIVNFKWILLLIYYQKWHIMCVGTMILFHRVKNTWNILWEEEISFSLPYIVGFCSAEWFWGLRCYLGSEREVERKLVAALQLGDWKGPFPSVIVKSTQSSTWMEKGSFFFWLQIYLTKFKHLKNR